MKDCKKDCKFCDSLKEKRHKCGMGKSQMAMSIEVPLRTYQQWEAGDRTPPKWCQDMVIERIGSFEAEV